MSTGKESSMKKHVVGLLGMLIAGGVWADTFFSLEKVPAALDTMIQQHQDVDLKLEENCSTGYTWVPSYDARVCSVAIEHKQPEFAGKDGSGGYAKIEIEPLSAASFVVTLNYIDSNNRNAVPAKTMKINVIVTNSGVSASSLPAQSATMPPQNTSPQQIVSAQIPVLTDDQSFRFEAVPPVVQTTLWVGQDIDFELEEKPEQNIFWHVGNYDASVCRIEIDHERGGVLKRAKAEVEIEAIRQGVTTVEFVAGEGVNTKTLRCTVTVK